mmetsp:Transcript_36357/g.41579  ORF Transcript_36357/g.41579 Transcript_36357/m.41579 type:complete len:378 (-) Transcript_36357:238-1371(-)
MITLSSPPSLNSINIIRCCDDDDADTIVVDYCCCSPNHLQAQRFNNIAATCMIEHGQQSKNYEKALSILETALRICEKEKDQEDVHEHFYEVCSCNSCSIDRLLSVSSECDSDSDNDMHEDNDKDGTTIYQNPISVQEGHNMGSTLTHIIAFNLALVYHLRFLMTKNNNDEDIEILINKALECYELAYECNLSDTCSLRFDEMICNNLSHTYRFQEQTEEERHFQQQQQQQQTLEQEKETLHHLQESISVSDDEDDNDEDVMFSNSSLDDTDDLSELESYSHHVVEPEDYEQERKQRKRKHNHKLTTTQRQRNKLLHVVDDEDLDQYPNVIDTCSVSHKYSSQGSGEERDTIHGEDDYTELCQQRQYYCQDSQNSIQ